MNAIAKPFGILLMWLYDIFGNYGIAVILFALIVKLILLPFMAKSKHSMMRTTRLQPMLKELEKKHGANKQKYNEEVQKLYKEEKINPMSGCIWTLIPFPFLIALYQAIRYPLTVMMGVSSALIAEGGAIFNKLTELGYASTTSAAYGQIGQAQFISNHFDSFASLSSSLRQISYNFIGLDLGQTPTYKFLWTTDWNNISVWGPGLGLFLIPVIAGGLTYLSTYLSQKMNPPAVAGGAGAGSMKSMTVMMPLITVWFAFLMPAALGIYWIASTGFGIIQDVWLTRRYKRITDAEDADRTERIRLREQEIEEKRLETERLREQNQTEQNRNTSKRKQTKLTRSEQEKKAAEWERKNKPGEEKSEPSRVENRRYARGRAYDPDRYFYSETNTGSEAEGPAAISDGRAPEEDNIPDGADDNSSDGE